MKNAEVSPNMSQNNHDSAHAFIVRIWTDEQDEQGQPIAWHGSIDHVGKGTRLYFLKLESIVQFVREHTGIKTQRGVSWVGWLRTRLKAVISDSH